MSNFAFHKKSWALPSWEGVPKSEVPLVYPGLKQEFSGVLCFPTEHKYSGRENVLVTVTWDLMRRLAREMKYDAPPVDYGTHGQAWLKIENSLPVGCVTTTYTDRMEPAILGAWVMPEYRRTGVLTEIYSRMKEYPKGYQVIRPSAAMRQWMTKVQTPADELLAYLKSLPAA